MKTYLIKINGIVQGVGFRPFIYNLAKKHNLKGEVSNTTEGVIIKANFSDKNSLKSFLKEIETHKPSPAVIERIQVTNRIFFNYTDFNITPSQKAKENFQLISPDIATCEKCQKEILDINNGRRYYYPFTNCTNCGPRFTIIKTLPYDRSNTTMKIFKMCNDCEKEYNDPLNRRFHAQPNACKNCGPKLLLIDSKGKLVNESKPIEVAYNKIMNGFIVGIKSLGGFQIACNALNDKAVNTLRKRKNRPFKPFALMFKDINSIKKYFYVSPFEIKTLMSVAAPIVLLRKKKKIPKDVKPLSNLISFENKFEGVMLPYTPLHHILFEINNNPLVMTSGNISEEPITSLNNEAINKLNKICDFFLMHDRPIYSKYDDSLVKTFKNKVMILRRARGYAPYPIKLNRVKNNKTVLALGAQEKNTFCIIKKKYAIVSQHLGDMDNADSINFFKNTLKIYENLFNIKDIDILCVDKHPSYFTTKYGIEILKETKDETRFIEVQHHKAHAAAVIAENNLYGKEITAFCWDGTGYGDDRKIWGSEIFYIDKKMDFKRIGHIREKILPGGEVTIAKPYRMALTYLYYLWREYFKENDSFDNYIKNNFKHFDFVKSEELRLIVFQIERQFNSIFTTSMGRFFDAVSSLLDIKHYSSYEGEAAVSLEMNIDKEGNDKYNIDNLILTDDANKVFTIDDIRLFYYVVSDLINGKTTGSISLKFHNTLANIILEISMMIRYFYKTDIIVLSGGVFQNNYLIKKTFSLLKCNGFKVFTNFQVPVNDGGISLGQAFIALRKTNILI